MNEKILKDVVSAFRAKNPRKLRKLNDDMVNEVVKDPSGDNINMALMTYVLSKIVSKRKFSSPQYKEHINHILNILDNISKSKDISAGVVELQRELVEMEGRDPRFIFDMITKGKVKIAATLYAKGISLSAASKMMGIAKEEVLSYAGKTMMFDRVKEEMPVEKRLKMAKEVFE